MRKVLTGLSLAWVLLLAGCNNWLFRRDAAGPQAARQGEAPTAAALVNYLNDNAKRIQVLDCTELDLDCRDHLQAVHLDGTMVCQKPLNLRMKAFVVGKTEVDIGSNDREFWFWIARAQPPGLFHCSYDD